MFCYRHLLIELTTSFRFFGILRLKLKGRTNPFHTVLVVYDTYMKLWCNRPGCGCPTDRVVRRPWILELNYDDTWNRHAKTQNPMYEAHSFYSSIRRSRPKMPGRLGWLLSKVDFGLFTVYLHTVRQYSYKGSSPHAGSTLLIALARSDRMGNQSGALPRGPPAAPRRPLVGPQGLLTPRHVGGPNEKKHVSGSNTLASPHTPLSVHGHVWFLSGSSLTARREHPTDPTHPSIDRGARGRQARGETERHPPRARRRRSMSGSLGRSATGVDRAPPPVDPAGSKAAVLGRRRSGGQGGRRPGHPKPAPSVMACCASSAAVDADHSEAGDEAEIDAPPSDADGLHVTALNDDDASTNDAALGASRADDAAQVAEESSEAVSPEDDGGGGGDGDDARARANPGGENEPPAREGSSVELAGGERTGELEDQTEAAVRGRWWAPSGVFFVFCVCDGIECDRRRGSLCLAIRAPVRASRGEDVEDACRHRGGVSSSRGVIRHPISETLTWQGVLARRHRLDSIARVDTASRDPPSSTRRPITRRAR